MVVPVTAEPIAEVVRDIRAGNVRHPVPDRVLNRMALQRAQQSQPVVDATALYRDMMGREEVDMYGDHPTIAPPWDDALVGFVADNGNVLVMQVHAEPWLGKGWETPNVVEWDRVRWRIDAFVWAGGRSPAGGAIPTSGPCHLTQFAVYDDGEPADLHYVHLLPDAPLEAWSNAQLTLLAALSFLNCSNVEIREPERRRPERRRLARLGVEVQAIMVRPIGSRTRSVAVGSGDGAVPLSSVRGHFSHYGPKYGKGLLFGRIEGRFWVPTHARGSAEADAPQRDYVLRP